MNTFGAFYQNLCGQKAVRIQPAKVHYYLVFVNTEPFTHVISPARREFFRIHAVIDKPYFFRRITVFFRNAFTYILAYGENGIAPLRYAGKHGIRAEIEMSRRYKIKTVFLFQHSANKRRYARVRVYDVKALALYKARQSPNRKRNGNEILSVKRHRYVAHSAIAKSAGINTPCRGYRYPVSSADKLTRELQYMSFRAAQAHGHSRHKYFHTLILSCKNKTSPLVLPTAKNFILI
jgi:hypothetical protein